MTDTGAPPPDSGDEHGDAARSELDKALDRLKRARGDADDSPVSSDGPTRMSWSSVTEVDPPESPHDEATPESDPSFRFDLGSALARLGTDEPAPPAPDAPAGSSGGPEAPPAPDLPRRGASPANDGLWGSDAPPASPAADSPRPQAPAPAPELPRREAQPPAPDVPSRDAASVPADLPRREPQSPAPDVPSRDAASAPADLPRREPQAPAPDLPRRQPPAASAPADLPRREAPSAPTTPDVRPPATQPAAEAAPTSPSAPAEPRPAPSANRSVFDDANPAPTLPRNPQRVPSAEPTAPRIPASSALPTLPASNPASPPPIAGSASSGPDTPDIHAVRSYQLRAERERRRSKMVGRSILFVVVLAVAAGAAFYFGRDLLFPTQWDASLTPIVDDVQVEHGAEFTDTIPLSVVADDEYVSVALAAAIGPDWAERLPQWRALGIANGGATAADATGAVVAWRPAIYDPDADTIYQAEGADPATLDAALRLALEEAFLRQQGTTPSTAFEDEPNGVVGVSSPNTIASHAIDRALLGGSADLPEFDATVQTPIPVLYELTAIDSLGGPLLETSPDESLSYGDDYPADLLDALTTRPSRASMGLLPNDAQSLADPVALGADGWELVWQNRLPVRAVDRLSTIVTADAYQPVMQGTSACFFAVFETATDIDGLELLGALTTWAAGAPAEARAIATSVSPTRVELQACDPGPNVDQPIDATIVTTLLERQIAGVG